MPNAIYRTIHFEFTISFCCCVAACSIAAITLFSPQLSLQSQVYQQIGEVCSAIMKSYVDSMFLTIQIFCLVPGTAQTQSPDSTVLEREPNSNFYQLLLLIARREEDLHSWLQGKLTYTSPECQNEIIDIMGRIVLRKVIAKVKANKFYTILVDESPDCSNKEQAVFCIRYVGKDQILSSNNSIYIMTVVQ